jgi:hypothetical protein
VASPPERFRQVPGRVAAQIREDYPVALRCQQGRNIDIAVDVVGLAVQQDYRRTIDRASFSVSNI